MFLKFGFNKYLPAWGLFYSSLLLLFVDSVFLAETYNVDIVSAKMIRHSKGETCHLTLRLQGDLYTRQTLDSVCWKIKSRGSASLTKSEFLGRWLSLDSPNLKGINQPFDMYHSLDWLCFLLLIVWPILSRFELKNDLKYVYYGGLGFLFYYSLSSWLLVVKT
ncbi:hypothetical protein QWY77_09290 [Thalassotalea ponticola]|uniref:hypothetical protein n=1 Tax=Thalassotalea ponticola TaxID=1523392 RepID=UPI0025B54A58|nr:hypothetical protein [Thalassotalea ponticola]MDN3652950.1 hypothetical protein [Thalassotalea ponticola]